VTGKWLFPQNLVEQWLENNAINFPDIVFPLAYYQGLLVLAGSNDILLDRTIGVFNETHGDHLAVFANLGSMGAPGCSDPLPGNCGSATSPKSCLSPRR
jgi:hypothetical protein